MNSRPDAVSKPTRRASATSISAQAALGGVDQLSRCCLLHTQDVTMLPFRRSIAWVCAR